MGMKPRNQRLMWVNFRGDGFYAGEMRWSRRLCDAQLFRTRALAESDVYYMRDDVTQIRVRVTIEEISDDG